MVTLDSLNNDFKVITNWDNQYFNKLVQYISQAIDFCGGEVKAVLKYHSKEEADADDTDITMQFPILLAAHNPLGCYATDLYVSRLYRKGKMFYVDGWDDSLECWREGWYVEAEVESYEKLTKFINDVLNRPDDFSWIKPGAKCRWNDPAIDDYQPEDRQAVLDRIFEIALVPQIEDDDDWSDAIITIAEVGGGSEAEVYAHELVQVD